jgi:hypothetical protein
MQASTDSLSDVSDGHSLFRHRVIPVSRSAFLKGQPIQPGDVKAVSRRPAVASIADVCRNTLFARDTDRRDHLSAQRAARIRERGPGQSPEAGQSLVQLYKALGGGWK